MANTDFGNMKLPEVAIAQLYPHSLIEMNVKKRIANKEKEQVIEQPIVEELYYLGENKKQITIVLNDADSVFINDTHLELLTKLLAACKFTIADVAIVNHAKHPLSYNEIFEKLSPKYLLCFEVNFKEIKLPFTIPNYQVQNYNQCKILFAASLNAMQNDEKGKLEKSRLWLSLKAMFEI